MTDEQLQKLVEEIAVKINTWRPCNPRWDHLEWLAHPVSLASPNALLVVRNGINGRE